MIRESNGRYIHTRTADETSLLLRRDVEGLTPDELEVLKIMLAELKGQQPPNDLPLLDIASQAEYRRTPVDMKTFIFDPEFLGNTCDNTYPVIVQDLLNIFDSGHHYAEVVLTGSIGGGKSYEGSIAICRLLYELSCMTDPHRSYGLAKDTNISIVCMSAREDLAVKVVFDNIAMMVKASPYFQKHFPFEATKKELRFPNHIVVWARAATDASALGLNTIGALLDEVNFLQRPGKKRVVVSAQEQARAQVIYNGIKRRLKSRFKKGTNPGLIVVVSSKNTRNDFTSALVERAKTDPSVYVRDSALWDVLPESYERSPRFWVLVGNERVASRIVPDDEVERIRADVGDEAIMIQVPMDFRDDFEADINGAIRDIAGIATVSVSPYIQRRDKITDAIDKSRYHPFSHLSYDPSMGGGFIWERLIRQMTERQFTGARLQRPRPLVNPMAPRHIHIDPSLKSDATGFCMAHVAGWKEVKRKAPDGNYYVDRSPVFYVDLVLQIIPPTGGELVLADIQHLVYDLTAHGFLITCVSADTYQSAGPLQELNAKGYRAEVVSVDRTIAPYEDLKMALYEDRVSYYEYPPLLKELQHLEYDHERKKVDHPHEFARGEKGSKDCSDSLAGVVHTLGKYATLQPMPIFRTGAVGETADPWMTEQRQAVVEGAGTNKNIQDPFGGGLPILIGSGDREDRDDGWGDVGGLPGGWSPLY